MNLTGHASTTTKEFPMGTLHIDGQYLGDDGQTYTVSGDLSLTPTGAGTPGSDGNTAGADPGSPASTDQGSPDAGATAAGPAPDAGVPADPAAGAGTPPADPGTGDGTVTPDPGVGTVTDPTAADTTNPPPDPSTGVDPTSDQPPAAGGDQPADPTTAGQTGAGAGDTTANSSGGPSGDSPAFPGELRRDDHQRTADDGVRTLQTQLVARGIETGKVDGFFGPRTESGVRTLQMQELLPVNGVVDATTWAEAW